MSVFQLMPRQFGGVEKNPFKCLKGLKFKLQCSLSDCIRPIRLIEVG